MGKGTHGHGQGGHGHSHDPEHPEDDWNLYSLIDSSLTTGLNVTHQEDVIGVFKVFRAVINNKFLHF